MKMIVVGLDGASWTLINYFCAKGYLPTFSKLIKNGKSGILKSTIPPHTAPGWVSSVTGVLPGEHGIYQFWDTQAENYVGRFMGSNDLNYPFVWDILNARGFSTGIINVPMTHPPKELNGYIFTWPLSNTLKYCYPTSLVREIAENEGQYVSDLLTMFNGDEKYIFEAIEITKRRLKTLCYLMKNKNTDFIMSVFTEIDRVSHFYWDYMDNHGDNEILCEAIKSIYIETDKVLEVIINNLGHDETILIYSDHGFEKGQMNFYVQTFLANNGFMKLNKASNHYTPKDNWFELKSDDGWYVVDWEHTIAYMAAPGSYGVNINLKGRQKLGAVDIEDYDSYREQIIKRLRMVRDPLNGSRLFKRVLKREEVYSGSCVSSAPDIIIIPENYGIMVHHKLTEKEEFSLVPEQKGMHSMDGICILYGEKVNEDMQVPTCIQDIAPTILKYYGIEIPRYMNVKSDVQVPVSANKSKCDVVKQSYEKAEEDSIKERLKNLGYY